MPLLIEMLRHKKQKAFTCHKQSQNKVKNKI